MDSGEGVVQLNLKNRGDKTMQEFPRTTVAGISLPRLLIGSNWMLGYSHTSAAADDMIKRRYDTREAVSAMVEAYLEYGINAMMAPFSQSSILAEGAKLAQQRTGRKVILIDTPILDMSDSREGREAALREIRHGKDIGSDFCLIHHASCEQLVSKLKGTMDRLPDYLDMIRQCGMVPGLSAHMPEIILYADQNEYDVETYIQMYNAAGFLMQVEVETVHKMIWQAKKPVMAIKPMAAGRLTPFVGLTFSFATLREKDMVVVGAHTPREVHEDVEIALAAIERRPPNIGKRSSPGKTVLHQ